MKINSLSACPKLVDREEDVTQIINLFQKAQGTQVHIIYAETGYGKSSFSEKLSQNSFFADWNIIKVKTPPQNVNYNVPEREYLDSVFMTMKKHFDAQGHQKLLLENYLLGNKNKAMREMFLEQIIDLTTSAQCRMHKIRLHPISF